MEPIRRTKIPTIPELRDHARAIATAFHILMVEMDRDPDDAVAILGYVVVTRFITDDTSYAVAMHELGHCLAPGGHYAMDINRLTPRVSLDQEEAAWDWAYRNALDWTPAMEQVRTWALSTYREV
jgi:hypothetical protein